MNFRRPYLAQQLFLLPALLFVISATFTLVIATKQDPSYLVNQPSTIERIVANHLGVHALPLGEEED